MKLEIFLALMENLKSIGNGLAYCMGISLFISAMAWVILSAENGDHSEGAKKTLILAKISFIFLVIGIFLCIIPTTDQLFHVRLNLIKFELASPENVKKGTDEIQRIADKLECKYLGCEDKTIPQKTTQQKEK